MENRKNPPDGLFEKIAVQFGVSTDEVVREMQAAIDTAWENSDPAVREMQRQMFPTGKPSIEEFIRVTVEQANG